MRVAVDAISAGAGLGPSIGGMVVYFEGLLGALCAQPEIEQVQSFVQPWNSELGMPSHPKIELVRCSGLPRNRVGRVAYEQTVFARLVERSDADVLFSTCNTRPLLVRKPNVVALQSLQHIFFPRAFGTVRRAYLNAVVPRSLRTATCVIAVSEWERAEALRLFDLDPSRVFTVHHGVSNTVLRRRGDHSEREGPPTIVMVSTLYAFKNHERLIRAFARVVREHRVPHELVIAGGSADITVEQLSAVAASEAVADRVHLLGPVPHDEVPDLLAAADVVAYPSLFETFGLPVIEALSYGAVVITSNVTSMPEVAGDAAILVDPYDVDDLAAGLASAILDEPLRDRLRRAGPDRAAVFTWERCAEGTLAALQFAVESLR